MAQEILQSAHQIAVADRAGQLIVQRKSWPVAPKTAADTIVVGYLPAGHRIHVQASQVVIEGGVANCDVDVCIGVAGNVLINTGSHTTGTLTAVQGTDEAAGEALGVSDENRPILLLVNSGTFVAGSGRIHADIAYYPETN